MAKSSREALLDMCTPLEEVEETTLKKLEDELANSEKAKQDYLQKIQQEYDSHGSLYRWLFSDRHAKRTRDTIFESRTFGLKNDLDIWKINMGHGVVEDDSFYVIAVSKFTSSYIIKKSESDFRLERLIGNTPSHYLDPTHFLDSLFIISLKEFLLSKTKSYPLTL